MADTFVEEIDAIADGIRAEIARGPLQGDTGANAARIRAVLELVLKAELRCVARYRREHELACALHGEHAARDFASFASEEVEHADLVAARLRALGASPAADTTAARESNGKGVLIEDLVRSDIIAERVIVNVYRRVVDWVAHADSETSAIMARIIEDEEHHSVVR